MGTALEIVVITLLYLTISFVTCFVYDFTRPVYDMVGPKPSIWFFPLYLFKCKQHFYETIGDQVEAEMKIVFGPGWTKDW
jgi:hypothetical protein